MAYTYKHGDRPLEGVTVQRAVGRGGFGEVYYAITDAGKEVALKYLRENPEIELRGIGHVMNLKSPHLVTIYDVRQSDAGDPFVVMEYVSGPSLRDLLTAQSGGMPAQKAAFLFSGIARGLAYLHERGIVHRDLKPANIFYDDGYVKIGDYGLSKHISVSRHSNQTVSVGTVHYMAPEIGSGSYTKAIDIYALGVILYEMLTGRLPFSGSSMGEVLMRHLRDEPDLSGIPAPFTKVIAKALEKDPADRYQDADEMLAAVMESADISADVASFDATALTQVPRVHDAEDGERTVTAGAGRPPGPPPLDVREQPVSKTFQFLGQARANVGKVSAPLPPRLQKRLDRIAKRLDQKTAALERKFGPGHARRLGKLYGRERADGPVKGRKSQILMLLVVTAGIALMLSFLHGGSGDTMAGRAVVLAMYMIGGTAGPLLTHLKLLRRSVTRNWVIDRLAYASLAALFMAPGAALASEEFRSEGGLARMFAAPLAALVICDWTRRMEAGRRGIVDGWAALAPAITGLIAAHIADAHSYGWTAAAVCAALSLMAQATAALWPHPQGAKATVLPGPGGPPPRQQETVPDQPGPEAAREAKADIAKSETRAAPPPPPPPEVASPSFAGRRQHAATSFLGKLLLLVGLVLALSQGALREANQRAPLDGPANLALHLTRPVPPGAIILALGLGALLLVFARRRAGVLHFLRGCLGCGLAIWGALMTMQWAGYPLAVLFTEQDFSVFEDQRILRALLGSLAPLIIGVLMLLWPRHDPNKPVVI